MNTHTAKITARRTGVYGLCDAIDNTILIQVSESEHCGADADKRMVRRRRGESGGRQVPNERANHAAATVRTIPGGISTVIAARGVLPECASALPRVSAT